MKNFSFEKLLIGVLIAINLCCLTIIFFISAKSGNSNNQMFFSYPTTELFFANSSLPSLEKNPDLKERFDKEFLNASYNLYQFFLYVKRLPLYVPYIEEKLHDAGLPDDLKYLPIAESALRNDVISTAGAAGIWQFMPDTAKQHGLVVNSEIDERYHFEKATDAAIEYLGELHERFQDWPLAIASYNRGPNAIARALEDQKVDSYFDLTLNEETSRYFFRILAIKYVMEEYQNKKSSINPFIGGVYKNPETKEISVGKITNLKSWAEENDYNYYEIKTLNPWILGNTLPEGNWKVKVMK